MDGKKLKSDLVLRWSDKPPSRSTVHRHYREWREQQGIPVRCDNEGCMFHGKELLWNGKALKPILDHINGNRNDNRPENLRYLCPNCDSQLSTRGGGNKGRVKNDEHGYEISDKDGRKSTLIAISDPPTTKAEAMTCNAGKKGQ